MNDSTCPYTELANRSVGHSERLAGRGARSAATNAGRRRHAAVAEKNQLETGAYRGHLELGRGSAAAPHDALVIRDDSLLVDPNRQSEPFYLDRVALEDSRVADS